MCSVYMKLNSIFEPSPKILEFEKPILKLKDLEIETIVLKLSPKELANKFYNVKTKKLEVLFKNKMEQQ